MNAVTSSSTSSIVVTAVSSVADLEPFAPAWEALASNAIVANPFFESWMLRPALANLASPGQVTALLIERRQGTADSTLIGVVPIERFRRFHGFPCSGVRVWTHPHAPLATPLLHRDHAPQVLGAILDHVRDSGAGLMVLDGVDAERSFAHTLTEFVNVRRLMNVVEDQHNRAFLRRRSTAEECLVATVTPKHRHEFRRQRRRLGEQGALESRSLASDGDVELWLDAFFKLEASGWKGAEGTAMQMRPEERTFFAEIVRAGFARRRLRILGLFLNGEPIALKIDFLAGGGAFTHKIAYDERYAKFSPGVLLEIDAIEDAHERSDIAWMDSCASPGHPMLDRLWGERRAIQCRVLSTGRRWANCVLGLTALARAIKRSLQ